jgi:hypothetical protein
MDSALEQTALDTGEKVLGNAAEQSTCQAGRHQKTGSAKAGGAKADTQAQARGTEIHARNDSGFILSSRRGLGGMPVSRMG